MEVQENDVVTPTPAPQPVQQSCSKCGKEFTDPGRKNCPECRARNAEAMRRSRAAERAQKEAQVQDCNQLAMELEACFYYASVQLDPDWYRTLDYTQTKYWLVYGNIVETDEMFLSFFEEVALFDAAQGFERFKGHYHILGEPYHWDFPRDQMFDACWRYAKTLNRPIGSIDKPLFVPQEIAA